MLLRRRSIEPPHSVVVLDIQKLAYAIQHKHQGAEA